MSSISFISWNHIEVLPTGSLTCIFRVDFMKPQKLIEGFDHDRRCVLFLNKTLYSTLLQPDELRKMCCLFIQTASFAKFCVSLNLNKNYVKGTVSVECSATYTSVSRAAVLLIARTRTLIPISLVSKLCISHILYL